GSLRDRGGAARRGRGRGPDVRGGQPPEPGARRTHRPDVPAVPGDARARLPGRLRDDVAAGPRPDGPVRPPAGDPRPGADVLDRAPGPGTVRPDERGTAAGGGGAVPAWRSAG